MPMDYVISLGYLVADVIEEILVSFGELGFDSCSGHVLCDFHLRADLRSSSQKAEIVLVEATEFLDDAI